MAPHDLKPLHPDERKTSSDRWETILDIPGMRTRRPLRNIVFLLTSLPLGLAAFLVAVSGFALGISLSWLLIGIPILIWTVGPILRLAQEERRRLEALLDLKLSPPRYPENNGANVFSHLLTIVRSPQVRGDIAYMLMLWPIGIAELALVLLPLEFLIGPFLHLGFGSIISTDVLSFSIDSRTEALGFFFLGLVLLVPMVILMNMVTNIHASLARRLLSPR